jgi:hypothetical protein
LGSGVKLILLRALLPLLKHAPVITLNNKAALPALPATSSVHLQITMDFIFVDNPDFDDMHALTDSFGFSQLPPPVTFSFSADLGLITLHRSETILLLTLLDDYGQGGHTLESYGSVDKVNAALQTMKYACIAADGCYAGFTAHQGG